MLAPSKTEQLPRSIRVGLESDVRFIVATWIATLRSIYPNRYAHDFFGKRSPDILGHVQRSSTLLVHLEGHPDEILSYLVFLRRRDIIIAHYAYTKDLCRRQGHLNAMLAVANPHGLPLTFTNPAKQEHIMKALCSKYIYDPSLWSET